MLTFAVAALALARPIQQQSNYILPLYDLVTSEDASGNVTAYFMLSTTWNSSIDDSARFRFFFQNGNGSNFTPNGNWYQVNPNSFTPISGNQVTVTFNANQFNGNNPQGTLWVMYNGTANECSNNTAEASVVATSVAAPSQAGHSGRPGSIAPIKDEVPSNGPSKQNNNLPVSFNVEQPFGGSWGANNYSYPNFWANTGQNSVMWPGNGWQALSANQVSTTNGFTIVSTTAHPNANAGFYCVGCVETYIPNESYNPNNWYWTEFSAVIRQFSIS